MGINNSEKFRLQSLNLETLKVHLSGDYGIKKLAFSYLKRKLGYNNRVPLLFIKDRSRRKVDNMLVQKINFNNQRAIAEENLAYVKSLGSYRAFRHNVGLPVRGQRTRTNGETFSRLTFPNKQKKSKAK